MLVVDDEPELASIVACEVEVLGFAPRIATNAEAGLHAFATGPVDILLTDVQMPRVSGVELAAHIAKLGRGDVPVIFMTALGALETRSAALTHVATLEKPFDFQKMRLAIRAAEALVRKARSAAPLS